MQTFLPCKDFNKCAGVLDSKRLFKQLIECRQILAALGVGIRKNDGTPYRKTHVNHPCVKLWGRYVPRLKMYHDFLMVECRDRGIKIKIEYIYERGTAVDPDWLTDDLCSMYRSLLLRKDPAHYGQFGWTDDPARPFVWPNGKVSKS